MYIYKIGLILMFYTKRPKKLISQAFTGLNKKQALLLLYTEYV